MLETFKQNLRSGAYPILRQSPFLCCEQDGELRYDIMAIAFLSLKGNIDEQWVEYTPGKYGVRRSITVHPQGKRPYQMDIVSQGVLPVSVLTKLGLTTVDQYHLQKLSDKGFSVEYLCNEIQKIEERAKEVYKA